MSLEAARASVGGNDTVLLKFFIIAAEGNALTWYSMLKPKSIYSWEYNRVGDMYLGYLTAWTIAQVGWGAPRRLRKEPNLDGLPHQSTWRTRRSKIHLETNSI
jgi:hypothetical protein